MGYAVWPLISTLLAVFVGLGWIGWRFFHAGVIAVHASSEGASHDQRRASMSDRVSRHPRSLRVADFGWTLLVASVVGAAVAGAWQLSANHVLLATVPERLNSGHAFRQLFNEEHLVPPPPLPPAMFADTGLHSLAVADRDWGRVDSVFAQRVLRVISRLEAQGFRFVLIEGYRSPDRQNALANGAIKVTHASAYRSRHQFGLAVDLAPVLKGRIVLSEKDPRAREAYQALGREADAEGLVWGGHWSLRDFGHLEAEAPASVADQS